MKKIVIILSFVGLMFSCASQSKLSESAQGRYPSQVTGEVGMAKVFNGPISTETADKIAKIEQNHQSCMSQVANNDVIQQLSCNTQLLKNAESELARFYESVMGMLNSMKDADTFAAKRRAEVANRFENSQKSWISYRNNNCKLESIFHLGEYAEKASVYECMARETVRRIKALNAYAF